MEVGILAICIAIVLIVLFAALVRAEHSNQQH
jgi:hypothetical protein